MDIEITSLETVKDLNSRVDLLGDSAVEEITVLHNQIGNHIMQTFTKVIRIGELLTIQKNTLPHGQFTKWIEKNLPFTDRTARNYMRVYQERDRLKSETVSDLTGAYRLLTDSKKTLKSEEVKAINVPVDCIPQAGHSLYIWFQDEPNDVKECVIVEPSIGDGYYYVTHFIFDSDEGYLQGTKKPIITSYVRYCIQFFLQKTASKHPTFYITTLEHIKPLNYNHWLFGSYEEYFTKSVLGRQVTES